MASVYRKEGTRFLWGKWSDGHGNVQRGSMETENEAEAQARADELERRARGSDAPAAAAGELTVGGFVGTADEPGEWLKMRKIGKPLAWRDDVSRFEFHFLPTFADKPMRWLETDDGRRAIFQWGIALPTHKARRDGKALASRTVWNVFSSVKVMLDDAVELQRLKLNPLASFRTDKYLPSKTDKVDGWRESAGFELEQVIQLCTSDKLRTHRRVWNTIAFLVGGGRTGEIANLRWSNWTESYKGGLGRLVIGSAWNSRAKVEKGTKTGAKKLIPVHPFAAQVLKDWHDRGWKEWAGRDPKPEDLIVPRSDFKQFGNCSLLDYFHADLKALSIARQRQYENRSTFRNLLLRVGAPEFVVNLMTHPAPKQASDFYTRLEMQWPAMCEAILRLRLPEGTGEGTGDGSDQEKARASEVLSTGTDWRGVRDSKASIYRAERSRTDRDPPARARTAPSLRVVPFPSGPDAPEPLPPVTSDLFVQAAAVAAQRSPDRGAALLVRGLAQAAALSPIP